MGRQRRIITLFSIALFLLISLASATLASEPEKIDVNKASIEELSSLKGIGQKYAERIVEYREKNGPFKKIDDILLVKGIGEKTFESIKDKLIIIEEPKVKEKQ